jgi:dTDP-glucose 4,6-dehydratase
MQICNWGRKNMLVLITGSCGFMMSNFIIYGQQETKWDFVSIDKLTTGSLYNISHNNTIYNKRHRLNIGDVCDFHFMSKILELEKPDIIIHCAGVGYNYNSPNNIFNYDDNIVGTKTIINACLNSHMPKKFINISSTEVYGEIETGEADETYKLNPTSLYAGSKAASDLIVQSYCNTFGFPAITVRCSNNFGPRQNSENMIVRIITDLLKNSNTNVYGNINNIRDWIYIKDTFRALQVIINGGSIKEVYNICSGNKKSNMDVVDCIFNSFNIQSKNKINFKNQNTEKDTRQAASLKKIKNLGWEPIYNFEEAIPHFIGWLRSNPWSWK